MQSGKAHLCTHGGLPPTLREPSLKNFSLRSPADRNLDATMKGEGAEEVADSLGLLEMTVRTEGG